MTIEEKMKAISANREAVAVADELLEDPNRTLDFFEIVEIVYLQFFGMEQICKILDTMPPDIRRRFLLEIFRKYERKE